MRGVLMAALCGLLWWFGAGGLMAEITVTAGVDPGATGVGEPVQFSLTIKGSQKVRQPPAVEVEGAQVQYLGPSMQTTLNNTELSVTMTHRYYITPQRTGDLTVPAVRVEIDGQAYQSQPVTIRVLEPGQADAPEPNQGAQVEVEIPKRPVYIGESFPVQVRLLVPSEIRWAIQAMPDFDSESFLKTPFQNPQQQKQNRNGRDYDVLTFRSVLTPIKSGTIPIGTISFRIQMASQKKRASQPSPFGGIFDGFPFDAQPTVLQERTLKLENARMQVLDLPTEGKPESFRGAIGQFRFVASTNQARVKVGEPLTVNIQVQGEGNFDRIEVPPLVRPDGWRIYPPETSFAKADDTGRRGNKTFRLALVPEMAHQQTPQFEFSYFDPESAKYVTQLSASVPLEVMGSLPPVTRTEPASAAPVPVPKPAEEKPVHSEVLEQNTASVEVRAPWSASREFWGVQAGIAALVGAWVALRWSRTRREHAGVGPLLRKEAAAMQSRLKGTLDPAAFLRDAIRIVQLRASARCGQPVGAIGAQEAAGALALEATARRELMWLFELDASARFAGASVSVVLSEGERGRILELLERSVR
jgi:hypothetical protein